MFIELLLGGRENLTNLKPQETALLLANRLNQLEPTNHIESVTSLYTLYSSDIVIYLKRKPRTESAAVWNTELLAETGNLLDLSTQQIQALLQERDDLYKAQFRMERHLVPLMGFKRQSLLDRFLRPHTFYAAVENIILCSHKYRGL